MTVERVYVAVDINNLWHSCREVFGTAARVDFPRLQKLIQDRQTKNRPRKLTMVAYAIALPYREETSRGKSAKQVLSRNAKFISYLRSIGFEVKTRNMRVEKGTKKAFHTDWDVGITIDAINQADLYDTFVLASGDGDYALLLRELKSRGKKTEVITVEGRTSSQLFATADTMIFLTKNEIFEESRIKDNHVNGSEKNPSTE